MLRRHMSGRAGTSPPANCRYVPFSVFPMMLRIDESAFDWPSPNCRLRFECAKDQVGGRGRAKNGAGVHLLARGCAARAADRGQAGWAANLSEAGEARFVIIVDQLEELFTQEQLPASEREAFVAALEALAKSGLVWSWQRMACSCTASRAEPPSPRHLTLAILAPKSPCMLSDVTDEGAVACVSLRSPCSCNSIPCWGQKILSATRQGNDV